jgi:predicted nucleic acid-binding protein
MKRIFLDTSAYSGFKRGVRPVLECLRHADEIHVNAIVVGELLAGFRGGRLERENRKELAEFLRSPRLRLDPLTDETSERYAEIFDHLRRAGRPIPTNDIWNAATAMQFGLVMLTTDRHYLDVRQIITELITGG